MSEQIGIHGGHNQHDPLRSIFVDDIRPTEQMPDVQKRCVAVWKEAINLCLRYSDIAAETTIDGSCSTQTPPITYRNQEDYLDEEQYRGTIVLRAMFTLIESRTEGSHDKTNPDSVVYDQTKVGIFYQLDDQKLPEECLMVVGKDEIWLHTPAGLRAGNHGQLNYFDMIVWQIRDKVISRSQEDKLEEQLDRESSRRHLQRAAQL